ncbi:MAG TPA: phosphatase PAP2 family protein [Polyangiales bacterium]|nr:phosphatase PAP2 family protein [Polyangiales bacterium]
MSLAYRRSLLLALVVVALAATMAIAQEQTRVEWQSQWRKMQPFEYVTAAVLGGSAVVIQFFVDSRTSGPYGGVLFDDVVRDSLRAETRSGRNTAKLIADWGYRAMLVVPYLDLAITYAIHGNSEVAWQMLLFDLEAQAVAGFLGIATNHFVGRARPSTEPCKLDPTYEDFCYRGSYSSFMSGHTVMAAAGAGVTCAHHLAMPLYGGGAGDIAACAATSAAAVAVGVSRIVNDRHWATDVVTGWLVGAAVGYLWPRLFHYRSAPDAGAPTYTIIPTVTPESYSASLLVFN